MWNSPDDREYLDDQYQDIVSCGPTAGDIMGSGNQYNTAYKDDFTTPAKTVHFGPDVIANATSNKKRKLKRRGGGARQSTFRLEELRERVVGVLEVGKVDDGARWQQNGFGVYGNV